MRRIVLIPSAGDAGFSEGPVLWACRSDEGVESGSLSAFSELAEFKLEDEDEIAVVVPGGDVVLHGVNVPVRAETQARIAASFALEDELAVDREEVFFALGPPAEAGWSRSVALVAVSKIDAWLSALKKIGISPNILVPDFLLLPSDEHTLRIVERGERILVRGAENIGFAADVSLLPLVLSDLLKRNEITSVEVAAADADLLTPEGGWGSRNVSAMPAPSDDAFAEFALDNLASAATLNLLQGAYAPHRSVWKGFEVWKRAAALAAAICIAYVGLLGVEGWRYASEAGRREARAEAVLRAAFPDIQRVVNPRAQMRARLADTGGGNPDQFFDLAAMVYGAANPLPTVEIEGMQYDNLRGDLAVDIAFQSYPDLEQLKTVITENGGVVEEGGSRQQGNRIAGEIRVAQR